VTGSTGLRGSSTFNPFRPTAILSAQQKKGARLRTPFSFQRSNQLREQRQPDGLPLDVLGCLFRLVMDQRGLVQHLEDLGQRGLLVGLLHCRQLTRQAR